MNKITKLLDEKFVIDLFRQEVLPPYPEYTDIVRVAINPYKKLIWETTYHIVFGFETYFINKAGKESAMMIVCSAHSDEPRRNVYDALKYLQDIGFSDEDILIPEPLFYSDYFQGTFYRGLEGKNFLHYIKTKDFSEIENLTKRSAKLFAKLHSLKSYGSLPFNPVNSRIETVIPGAERILEIMAARYNNKYSTDLHKIYEYLITNEDKFLASKPELSLIHGDAHPENVIVISDKQLGLIDFTDLCLGDFARDLGSFLQQLEYKIINKVNDVNLAQKMKDLFLKTYLETAQKELDVDLQTRINLYYNWTAIRTATYWFLKAGHSEERGIDLLEMVKRNLQI